MKRLILLLCLGLAGVPAASAQWFTDLRTAQDKARQENKFVLLDFTGSDWCGWCMKLKGEVFDQPEFIEFARQHLVLVEVDFPRNKPMDDNQRDANQRLAETFHIEGYPTIILLNAYGQQVGQTGYMPGGPRAFDENLTQMLKLESQSPPSTSPSPAPRKPLAIAPFPPGVSNYYGALVLKGISGTKDRRMVLINNATLMVGETAGINVESGRVAVTCKEIRDDSVLVTVDGKPTELKLKAN